MLSFDISCWDLVKFHYFADTTERGDRGWKQAQRPGEELVTLLVTLISKGWVDDEADPRVMGRVVWPMDFGLKTCVPWKWRLSISWVSRPMMYAILPHNVWPLGIWLVGTHTYLVFPQLADPMLKQACTREQSCPQPLCWVHCQDCQLRWARC
jgi:hypothetical protein